MKCEHPNACVAASEMDSRVWRCATLSTGIIKSVAKCAIDFLDKVYYTIRREMRG